MEEEKA